MRRTRLVPPRLRTETVDRPALVARRLTSPDRLGVVTGPAGSGKSTLLAQCHSVDPFPAWLSLEPGVLVIALSLIAPAFVAIDKAIQLHGQRR